tara:strand:+ start:235 stop:390 length:156 start_codon:yes stop_codon:yes gene_type:complete
MQSKTPNSQMSKSLDNLKVTLDIQAKAYRMTIAERKEARRLMKIIIKTDKK